jgi:hypothetical protein
VAVTSTISPWFLPVATTFAPAVPNAIAIALPMPLDAPVTSTVFPESVVMGRYYLFETRAVVVIA